MKRIKRNVTDFERIAEWYRQHSSPDSYTVMHRGDNEERIAAGIKVREHILLETARRATCIVCKVTLEVVGMG